jgi:hypothetical protein
MSEAIEPTAINSQDTTTVIRSPASATHHPVV